MPHPPAAVPGCVELLIGVLFNGPASDLSTALFGARDGDGGGADDVTSLAAKLRAVLGEQAWSASPHVTLSLVGQKV